jgi:hypothetical protein
MPECPSSPEQCARDAGAEPGLQVGQVIPVMAGDMGSSAIIAQIDDMTDRVGAVFQVTFQAQPDSVTPILRLKALLKRAGRDLSFKCLSVRDLTVGVPRSNDG